MTTTRPEPPTNGELLAFHAALRLGAANAQTAEQIAHVMGIGGKNADRYLRNLAQHSVDAGLLVCSGNAGYWKPESVSEVEETIGRLESQAKMMLQRSRALRVLMMRTFNTQQSKLF